jgi:hypothetical protein
MIAPTPLECALQSQRIYTDATGWAHYWSTDDVVVGHKEYDNFDLLSLRGTACIEDVIRDIMAALPAWHDQLGFVAGGFMTGLDDVFAETRAVVGLNAGKPLYITGHSLGGARARLLAGLYVVNRLNIAGVTVFGSPKPAFANLGRIFQKARIVHDSYRFYNDGGPLLPLTFEPCFDFVHTEAWTPLVGHSPAGDLGPLRDHAIANYIVALTP